MMKAMLILVASVAVLAQSGVPGMAETIPTELRCEYLTNPLAIQASQPRLSWVVTSTQRGMMQSAYQILVSSSEEGLEPGRADLWDSGQVASNATSQIAYAGRPLPSRQQVCWKVRVWDGAGKPSAWSKPATWRMGLLAQSDWKAQWIGRQESPPADQPLPALPATMLRKGFRLADQPRRAIAYASALGLYELSINGRRVGEQLLAPEWTNYHKRVQYQAYDVTSLLQSGENAMGALLADGWYAGRLGISHIVENGPVRGHYGRHPRLLVQLEIEHADGRVETIVSDPSWRATTAGPVRKACILDGEVYDARQEQPGWDRPGFADVSWEAVGVAGEVKAALVAQPNEPIRVTEELRPVAINEPAPGVYVVDFGQNLAGWCRLRVQGPAGATVTLRHAEVLEPDGNIYTDNLRTKVLSGELGARQTDQYTLRGEGIEQYEPRFTYHGFRYVELTGMPKPPTKDTIIARAFHSAPAMVGAFECSSPLLTKLMRNIQWTQRDNMHSIPTDCPQRDERVGWTGDIVAFGQTACLNMDMAAFLNKWLYDLRDDQADDGRYPDFAPHPFDPNARFSGAAAWGDAGVIVPWIVYVNYGDRRLIETHYESAKRWVEYVHSQSPQGLWTGQRGNDYGDWLNGDTLILEGYPKTGAQVPKEAFATAFHAYTTVLLSRMAGVLNRKEDASRYADLARQVREAFNRAYVAPDGRIAGNTPAGYALALDFGLLPPEHHEAAVRYMIEGIDAYKGHISTGFHTTVKLMLALTRGGRNDVAYRLINNRTIPSWGYTIDQGGTTIWERWDGYVEGRGYQDPGMNSFCHYAIGAVGEWMYRVILGIAPDEETLAYKHVLIEPRPGGGLSWARGHYDSIRGRIASEWRVEGGSIAMTVSIPANVSATVRVPTSNPTGVTEGGQPATQAQGVTLLRTDEDAAVYKVGSGTYRFVAEYAQQ
ncbi:MAG: family 78 glycoside hydrolase catalytic domain [Phycisphaerae bacterium]|nr:family 78 glycoside hydrolase catalytic domain [Phycisphaerae bacterium]